jgi:putative transposase
MPDYRRVFIKGGTYFFTVVTPGRMPLFKNADTTELLVSCFKKIKLDYPFKINASVILPDHLHAIWTLPENDSDFSLRWRLIKKRFTLKYAHGKVWLPRFWEHLIPMKKDYERHCDYIHYNPVKHGLVEVPEHWQYSSYHAFVGKGHYSSSVWIDDISTLDFE